MKERRREHEAPHERMVDQQVLDALLRIEELLKEFEPEPEPAKAPKHAVETEDVFDPDGHKVGSVRKNKRKG